VAVPSQVFIESRTLRGPTPNLKTLQQANANKRSAVEPFVVEAHNITTVQQVKAGAQSIGFRGARNLNAQTTGKGGRTIKMPLSCSKLTIFYHEP